MTKDKLSHEIMKLQLPRHPLCPKLNYDESNANTNNDDSLNE